MASSRPAMVEIFETLDRAALQALVKPHD